MPHPHPLGLRARGVPAAILLALAGCTSERPAEGTLGEVPPGALRGELVVYVADFGNGITQERFALWPGGDERDERPLVFDRAPEITPGDWIDVWGRLEGEGLRVTRFARVERGRDGLASLRQALIGAPPYRPRRLAFVMVDIGGGVKTTIGGQQVDFTTTEAMRRLVGTGATDASLRQYYIEASFGRQDLGAQVFGPFPFTMNGCNTRDMATMLRPMIPEGFDHYLWYMGTRTSNCAWTGLATTGSPERPTRDTWYNGSTSCVVLVQEPGHNFGMRHSSSIRCPGAPFHDTPEGNCTHSEYGDPYDPMGRGCRHMNGYQKAYQGWFGGCNVVDATQSGTYTLLPIELPCNGAQVLQVPMPRPRPFSRMGGGAAASTVNLTHYYLEMRTGIGFDRGLPPSVQIRVSGDIRLRTQGGLNTWLLDMNPATASTFEGLGAGGSYTDPAGGIKFTVEAIDATRATVRIELETEGPAPVCLDGTSFRLPGPGPDSCAGGPATPGAAPVPPPDGGVARTPDAAPARDAATGDAAARDAPAADAAVRPPDAAPTRDGPAARPDDAALMSPLPDARPAGGGGAGGSGAGGTGGLPMPAAGGAGGGEIVQQNADDGCGCRLGGRPAPGGGAALLPLLGLVALAAGRSRRRR